MADPLSLVASTAGVVGLLDVLCRASRELCVFFSSVKNASKEIQNVLRELEQLNALITDIQNYVDTFKSSLFVTDDGLSPSRLISTLQACRTELDALKAMVDALRGTGQPGVVKRLASRVKWASNDKKLVRHQKKLEELKTSLNTTLSIVGR